MHDQTIIIRGATQNNLKALDLDLPLGELIVVTGVSGSGKSSLAFDTIYAEGQRRYVETFSPYARQFLDRMDKPRAERIEGIPPAIAIDQTNPVRTSRSTVGTMTELNDHLKLLFARAARLYCRGCGALVKRDSPDSIVRQLPQLLQANTRDVVVTFPVTIPDKMTREEIEKLLEKQGYRRTLQGDDKRQLDVIQGRIRFDNEHRSRLQDDLEVAFRKGQGKVAVRTYGKDREMGEPHRFSADLHCPHCDFHYRDPIPNLFSFNSPIGACDECRGFGRVIGVDYGLVVPDRTLTLAKGAIKPWQSKSYSECQDDMMRFARQRGVPTDVPWSELSEEHRQWVLQGEGSWKGGHWYGASRFFDWLETKAYKMHVRVMLSRYRAYRLCPDCQGARLKPESLQWRIGPGDGLNLHDVMMMPLDQLQPFMRDLHLPSPIDDATEMLLDEINTRLGFLHDVGLGYLTLDRQSRTLSGGEVQRINLTTALGTSLVNTLFVLDEPSIGLHPRDIQRLIRVLHRLRDAGNTLLVVEHDPEVILAADRVLDLGPGPGERGGDIVFFGSLAELKQRPGSLTAHYLTGQRSITSNAVKPLTRKHPRLHLSGAAEHNLKGFDVQFPLNRFVCLTGVSGSGKSTLLEDILYPALLKAMQEPTEAPGAYTALSGAEHLTGVVMVDQSPIGKTTRSNPISYVGALDDIRKLFAKQPLAEERHYTPGTFSFNSGKGRCPTCSGNGFERVEMQFLSDVYIRCPDCDGKRYRDEVLEVTLPGNHSIADILEMTVAEACDYFAEEPKILRAVEPLRKVGLDYLQLGQPVPTLSGGEAQRLKLAGHLADSTKKRDQGHLLFLFDEPTTGLHFADIATLLDALNELVEQGHSAIVIEHNLDVIRSADWIVDLGPEGGDAGGELVCVGTPDDLMACTDSHTGQALKDYLATFQAESPIDLLAAEAPATYKVAKTNGSIRIHNAREHNLREVDIDIPRDKFTVITGISGSGKSTVAFDILFNEGQRRYLESLNAYARQFVQPAARPDVDAVQGVPPTVAIEQRTSRGGRKSTVATVTEIYHFLRLLFVKLGTQYCPDCSVPIEPQTPDAIVARLYSEFKGTKLQILAPLILARKGYYTDLAKWANNKGFEQLRVDGEMLPTAEWPRLDRFKEHTIELPVGEVTADPKEEKALRALLKSGLDYGKGVVHVLPPRRKQPVLFSTQRACPGCGRSFAELDPRLFSYNSKHGWCRSCYGTGQLIENFDEEQTGEEPDWRDITDLPCPTCDGRRLRPEALAVRFQDRSIADFASLSVQDAAAQTAELKLNASQAEIARDLLAELRTRLGFLSEVGLPYLSLDRAAPTLSGGEAQRIRLAAQLGSNLRGVCYILDEPTIGLHPRDNRMLLDTLRKLEAKGNTVVVVEHDEETIRQAEHVIDLGPGAGVRGGYVVATGTPEDIMQASDSLTGQFLREPLKHPLMEPRETATYYNKPAKDVPCLEVVNARLHNLQGIDIRLPLQRLVCVTGVSGSGKSTLVRNILHDNLAKLLSRQQKKKKGKAPQLRGCADITGVDQIGRVLEVDQTPIGKTPRSCPATYVGFWDNIRRLYASVPEAKIRGYTATRFSFNTKGGRCQECNGQGMQRIEMSFLPDVRVICDACQGQRFDAETLAITYQDKSIADVLAMSVEEAVDFFKNHRNIHRPLKLLRDVGLGYLTLGQQSPTLSGGEAQRIKLVSELAKAKSGSATTLYILDEPTIGLHMADVEKLIRVLHRLVEAGHSVIIIEHNLDVIAEADWLVDLGPEGGDGGGKIVAQGPPAKLASRPKKSHTSRILAEFLT